MIYAPTEAECFAVERKREYRRVACTLRLLHEVECGRRVQPWRRLSQRMLDFARTTTHVIALRGRDTHRQAL